LVRVITRLEDCLELLDSEPNPAKLNDVSFDNLDVILFIFHFYGSILNLPCRNHFVALLVLEAHYLPSLFSVAVIFVHLALVVVQTLGVEHPVGAVLVDNGEEHSVVGRSRNLRNHSLKLLFLVARYY